MPTLANPGITWNGRKVKKNTTNRFFYDSQTHPSYYKKREKEKETINNGNEK